MDDMVPAAEVGGVVEDLATNVNDLLGDAILSDVGVELDSLEPPEEASMQLVLDETGNASDWLKPSSGQPVVQWDKPKGKR